jgi:PAS domain S-box-containing protein
MPHDKFSIGGAETDPVGGAAKFALLYLGAALAWLFVTDWLVLAFFEDTPRLQTIKGALFMAMSAVIVWAILYHNTRQWRKQNASLHRQVAFSRGLIEASPIPIVVLDADSKVVLWSPMARAVFGWESGEVEESRLPCFADDHQHWNADLWERICAGRSVDPFECEAIRSDGSPVDLRVSIARLDDTSGAFAGAIVMLQDVSDHRAAVDRLRASERRLRTFFEHNPRPMWVYDLDTLHFVHVNRAAGAHYGYSDDEWRAMTIFDIRPESEHERLRKNLDESRSRLESTPAWIHRKKSGELIEVNIDSHTITLDGQAHVLVVVEDVTERNRLSRDNEEVHDELRQMTARLLHAQEAERRHIARELHDESGAMLTALQVCLRMANERVRPDNDPARNELREAESIAVELADKIRSLSTGLLPGVLDDLGLAAAVKWLAERLKRQTGLEVHFVHDLGPSERFSIDVETIVYRVIQEALTNVMRHAQVDEATVVINRRPSELEVHVIDDGVGFERDDAIGKGHLGLHSMRERSVLIGGILTVTSARGEGTRVSARIPVEEA